MSTFNLERGTGRTKRMVMSLPEGGCAVVLHNHDFIAYIRHMISDLRGGDFLKTVRFATLECVDHLRGFDRPICVDHFVAEYASDRRLRREYDILFELKQRQQAF